MNPLLSSDVGWNRKEDANNVGDADEDIDGE